MADIFDKARRDMAELGQGGAKRLWSLEDAWEAFKADASDANRKAVDAALKELHKYGADAFRKLGLTLSKEPSSAPGVVLLRSGGTDKDDEPGGKG